MSEYSEQSNGHLQVLQYATTNISNTNGNIMHSMNLAPANTSQQLPLLHHQHTPPHIDSAVDNAVGTLNNHLSSQHQHHHHHHHHHQHHPHEHQLHHHELQHLQQSQSQQQSAPQQLTQHHHSNNEQDNNSNHNANLSPDGTATERCRFCGQDLPMDAFTVVAHFNNHWRQFNLEAINPCLYESHPMVDRLSNSQFMHSQTNGHPTNDHVNSSNQLMDNQTGVIHTHNGINQPNTFPYTYSPQTEPSNLSIPGNPMKCNESEPSNLTLNNSSCMENEPSNLSMHQLSNNSSQEDPSNLCITKAAPHSSMVCNSVLGMSSPHHSMDSPGLSVAGNRCSPLNLTGRPKLVQSPIVTSVNMDGTNSNSIASMEHPCVLHSDSNHIGHNIQSNEDVNFSPHLNNVNQISHVQSFTNNFSFSNNYFPPYPSYAHQQITADSLSCRMQNNYSNNLENVGLSIPIISPHLESSQRDEDQCLDPGKQTGASDGLPLNNDGSIETSLPLSTPCVNILPSCNHSETERSDIIHPPPEENVCNERMNSAEHPQVEEKQSDSHSTENPLLGNSCNQIFSDKLIQQNSSMVNLTDTKKHFVRNSPDLCLHRENSQLHISCNSFQTHSDMFPVKSDILLPATTAPKPYKCSICNKEFSVKEELRDHFQGHEAAKPFHCDICGLGVSNNRALKRHKLTHTGHKPYKCDTCGKSFLQKHDLNRHMNVHERPKYFTCEQCKRIFTAISSFKSHKCKGVQEVRPFLCHICGDGCTNRLAWSYHMWKHTKNPMFVPFQDNLVSEETA